MEENQWFCIKKEEGNQWYCIKEEDVRKSMIFYKGERGGGEGGRWKKGETEQKEKKEKEPASTW